MFGVNKISFEINNFIQQLIRNDGNIHYNVTKDCREHLGVCRIKQLRNKTIKSKSPFPLNLISFYLEGKTFFSFVCDYRWSMVEIWNYLCS